MDYYNSCYISNDYSLLQIQVEEEVKHMDSRDLALILIGLLIGTGIGYISTNILKSYVQPYIFDTTLALETNSTITVGQQLIIYGKLDVTIPSELIQLQSYIKPHLLQDKQLNFMYKTINATYWTLISTETTVYSETEDKGICATVISFNQPGTYILKVCFYGTNLLNPCESQEVNITVT